VSKGAEEVRKFLDRTRANRVILISDGIANVGPSSPAELGELGSSLIKEGISVTTIGLGLGFNEDLMSRLSEKSDGNHYFAEKAEDLVRVFRNELGDILSVVAQEVLVKVECAEGIRPVRFLGRFGDIAGQTACVLLNQLYSEQEKYVLLEIEVPAAPDGAARPVASVSVSYANMQTKTTDILTSAVSVRFSNSEAAVAAAVNPDAMTAAVEQIAAINSENAIKLRDLGKVADARQLLLENKRYLEENADKYQSKRLKDYADKQEQDEQNLEGAKWPQARKAMTEELQSVKRQQ
jgi:Ca-activated chloride channel family protein